MEDLSRDQIGDYENTPIFPSEENWLGFRRRLSFPAGERNHARLQPSNGFLHHTFRAPQTAHWF